MRKKLIMKQTMKRGDIMSKDKKGCGCGCLSVLCVMFVLGAIGSSVSEKTTSNETERTVLQNEDTPAETQISSENSSAISKPAEVPDTSQTVQESAPMVTEMPAETTTQMSGDEIQAAIEAGDYSLVTPAFKQTMDSYEQFFDQYIAFMNKYKNADSMDVLSMINEYSQFMTNYVKMMDSMEKLGNSEMTTADNIYYIMVTARIEAKLVGVIGE